VTALAVIFERPEHLILGAVPLAPAGDADVVVDIDWTGISTGTEKLLYFGRMPAFPGMGYPLIPGYEAVGRVRAAGDAAGVAVGQRVFVPGARWPGPVRGLFGAAASCIVVPGSRVIPVDESWGEKSILLSLAATAYHAVASGLPELVVGHGVLGRLIARIGVAMGCAPVVWERQPARFDGAVGYVVTDPDADTRRDYARICDASGDSGILDALVARLARGGEVVLAGFYEARIGFDFAPAFIREARFRIATEFSPADLAAVVALVQDGKLSLDGLLTHQSPVAEMGQAYRTAFTDPHCLKMVLDWRSRS